MKRLSRNHHVFVLDPKAQPATTVAPGEELLVELWDALHGNRDPDVLSSMDHMGPATGPIWVEGAQPGDTLKIDLLEINVLGDALHFASPGRGFLPKTFDRPHATPLPVKGNHLLFPGSIRVPLRPSLGLIATTPSRPKRTSSDSGSYGGDIDLKELVAGSSVYLPVLVAGGLLVLGDCHAAVGDGAVGGTGAECPAELRLRIQLEKGRRIRRPRALTPDYFVTIAPGANVARAMRQAVQDMVDFLTQEKGMEPYNAYSLLSLAGDIRVSRVFRPISPVKMLLSRQVLEQVGLR